MRNKLTGLMLSASLLLSGLPVFSKTYTDVPANEWYASYIESISNKGLMSGYENGNFGPNDRITRGMLAQILYNRDGKPDIASPVLYGDVPESAFYKNAVSWVSANGYMTGYGNGLFGGQDDISREQMITALQRYALKKGNFDSLPAAPGDITKFPDYNQVSDFAIGPMNWAYALRIVGGRTTLNPRGKTSRAEAAKMLDIADDMITQRSEGQPSQEPSVQEPSQSLEELQIEAARNQKILANSADISFGIKKDGIAVVAGGVYKPEYQENGEIIASFYKPDISNWKDLISIVTGGYFVTGLKKDGTVYFDRVENSFDDQLGLPSDWTDIIAIDCNGEHVVGQKKDGSLVAAGYNYYGQCDISDWKDIKSFAAGWGHTVGVKSDGTVVAKGRNDSGQCEVSGWRDIVSVSASVNNTAGLRKDGTVVVAGDNYNGQCNTQNWKDIISVLTTDTGTFGLKKDGTVIAVGNNENHHLDVSEWKDIVAIGGKEQVIGLKKDGSVVFTTPELPYSINDYTPKVPDLSDWTNIGLSK